MKYSKEYLVSDDWLRRKNDLLSLVKGCSLCGKTENLTLHHLHYQENSIGVEQMKQDVVPVCNKPCHGIIHANDKLRYRAFQEWNDRLRQGVKPKLFWE